MSPKRRSAYLGTRCLLTAKALLLRILDLLLKAEAGTARRRVADGLAQLEDALRNACVGWRLHFAAEILTHELCCLPQSTKHASL